MASPSKTYSLNADIIRILAISMVIAVHVYYPLYSRPNYLGGISWWYAHLVSSLTHIGVPLFIMLSGYLSLHKPIVPIQLTLKKTFNRIVLPLAIWSALYMFWDQIWFGRVVTLNKVITSLFTASLYHFYFLVILLGLYVVTPFIKAILMANNTALTRYLVGLSIVVTFVSGFAVYYLKHIPTVGFLNIWLPYLSYYLIGHLVRQYQFTAYELKLVGLAFSLFFIHTIIVSYLNMTMFATNTRLFWIPAGSQYFQDPLAPNVFLLAITAFILLINLPVIPGFNKTSFVHRTIRILSASAYGMYIVHLIIIDYLDKQFGWVIHLQTSQLWLFISKKMLIVTLISFVFATLARKLPLLKRTLGET
jgi:surface polysaccharide O-acyltransferase-like enzyme